MADLDLAAIRARLLDAARWRGITDDRRARSVPTETRTEAEACDDAIVDGLALAAEVERLRAAVGSLAEDRCAVRIKNPDGSASWLKAVYGSERIWRGTRAEAQSNVDARRGMCPDTVYEVVPLSDVDALAAVVAEARRKA